MMLKDDVSMIANKDTDSDLNQLNKKYQSDIDALADEATKQSLSIFDKIFEPVRQLLADAKSLEDIKEQFESDDFVEKLYEELITQGEGIVATSHEKIMVLKRDGHGSDSAELDRRVRRQIDHLLAETTTFEPARIKSALKDIVPEYAPANHAASA